MTPSERKRLVERALASPPLRALLARGLKTTLLPRPEFLHSVRLAVSAALAETHHQPPRPHERHRTPPRGR